MYNNWSDYNHYLLLSTMGFIGNNLMKTFILSASVILGLVSAVSPAKAEQSVSFMVASKHINAPNCIKYGTKDPCTWNERNLGLSYNYDLSKSNDSITPQAIYGLYHNSFGRLSSHIGIGYRFKYGGAVLSAITGYPMLPIMPSLATYMEIPVTQKVRVQLVIPYMPGGVQAVALQLRYIL